MKLNRRETVLLAIALLLTFICQAFAQTTGVTVVRQKTVNLAWGASPDDAAFGGTWTNMYYKLYMATNATYSGATVITNCTKNTLGYQTPITLEPNTVYWFKASCTAPDELESDPTSDFLCVYVTPRKPKSPLTITITIK